MPDGRYQSGGITRNLKKRRDCRSTKTAVPLSDENVDGRKAGFDIYLKKDMKRTLFNSFSAAASLLAALFVSASLTSCGDDNKEGDDEVKSLTVSQTSLTFEATASTQSLDVTVTGGVAWAATASDSWVHVTPAVGTSSSTLTVTVDENPNRSSRVASLTISGTGVTSTSVVILQNANDTYTEVSKTLALARFYYYGDALGTDGKCAAIELVTVDAQNYPANLCAFILNVPYDTYENCANSVVGTFTANSASTPVAGTVQLAQSVYRVATSADVYTDTDINDATITISATSNSTLSVSLDFYTEDGVHYTGTYNGDFYYTDGTIESTLDGDYTLSLSQHSANIYDMTDSSFPCTLTDIYFAGVNSSNTVDYVSIELLTSLVASADKDISGTYTAFDANSATQYSDFAPGQFLTGYYDDEYGFVGSWYLETDSQMSSVKGNAPMVGGTITIKANDGGGYTFTFNTVDDAGNKITGTYTASSFTMNVNPSNSSSSVSACGAGRLDGRDFKVRIAEFNRFKRNLVDIVK